MESFSKRAFRYSFGIAVSMSFAVALAVIAMQDRLTVLSVLLAILLSLVISAVLGALIACYRYPKRWLLSAIRSIMRSVAKRAIRLSLRHAMTRIECSGILEIDGGVALQVLAGTSNGVAKGTRFRAYEATDNQLWGRVEAFNMRDADCDCIPFDRVNREFWGELENRKLYNTEKPPNIYLLLDIQEINLTEQIENLLDNWR